MNAIPMVHVFSLNARKTPTSKRLTYQRILIVRIQMAFIPRFCAFLTRSGLAHNLFGKDWLITGSFANCCRDVNVLPVWRMKPCGNLRYCLSRLSLPVFLIL